MKDKKRFAEEILRKRSKKNSACELVAEEDFAEGWEGTIGADPTHLERLEREEREERLLRTGKAGDSLKFRSWRYPANRKTLEKQFAEQYADYITPRKPRVPEEDSRCLNDLLELLGKLCTYVIYNRIRGLMVYSLGDEETITQEGHEDAFLKLAGDKASGRARPGALFYYTTIYRNKTIDYLRHYGLWKSKAERERDAAGIEKRRHAGPRKSDINNAASIEGMATNREGEIKLDQVKELAVRPFDDESKLSSAGSRELLMVYLRTLLDYRNKPAGPLAVVYARILYQLERQTDPETIDRQVQDYMARKNWSMDPTDEFYDAHLLEATSAAQKYTTATNPDWAISRMGNRNIAALVDDSEDSLNVNFSRKLRWGEAIRADLCTPFSETDSRNWCDVIYTHTYSKRQLEHWAADVHNATIKRAVPIVRRDTKLLAFVLEDVNDSNQMKKEIQNQMNKEQNKRKEAGCR